MFCEKCGNQIEQNNLYCQSCGHKCAMELVNDTQEEQSESGGWRLQKTLMILSLLILASIIFLPMYNRGLIMGEIYPNDQSVYFTEVIEMVLEESDAFRYYVVAFTFTALVADIILFLSALFGSQTLCVLSSIGGAGGMLYHLCKFIAQQGADDVFSFDETAICVGFWVTLILFIISFLKSIKSN